MLILRWIPLVLLAAFAPQNPTQPETLKPGTIGGVVLNAVTETPLAGVVLQTPNGATVTTNSDGRFLLENLATGPQNIRLSKEGFRTITYPPTLASGQHLETTQRMSPLTIATGRVVDEQGRPVTRGFAMAYHYEFRQGNRELLLAARADIDDRGDYRLSVDPDSYIIRIFPPRGSPLGSVLYPGVTELSKSIPVELKKDGEPRTIQLKAVTLSTATLGWIRVRIVNATGEPILPISGIARGLTLQGWGTSFVAGQRGDDSLDAPDAFGTPNMESRSYRPDMLGIYDIVEGWDRNGVSIRGGAHVDFKGSDVDVVVAVNKPSVSLGVRIVMEQTDGTPPQVINGASLNLQNEFGWSTFTGASGTDGTMVKAVYPGLHRIAGLSWSEVSMARTPGIYIASAQQGDRDVLAEGLMASGDRASLTVTLRRAGGSITGVVTGGNGQPIARAGLGLVPDVPSKNAINRTAQYRSVRTGTDGAFSILGVLPGSYQLYSWTHCPDCAPGENSSQALLTGMYKNAEFMKQFEGKGIPVTIDAEGMARVALKVLDE